MVDLQSNNIKIKSSINDYEITFIDNHINILNDIINEGDVIIVDKVLLKLYPEINNIDCLKIHVEVSENMKSFNGVATIIDNLLYLNFKKNNKLIAIGGGVVQDITAFISMTLFRGVKWIFFPTTLLSQGDSCIGSKSSINFKDKKNQLGGFYPPKHIFIDLNFLKTLPDKDILSGQGEMLHYFLISGEEDLMFFKNNINEFKKIIFRSLEIKKRIVEIDEFDRNERRIFNYGHSFGHAIESITNYRVPHGIAVCYGMDIANYFSLERGDLSEKEFNLMRTTILDILQKFHYIDNANITSIQTDNLISKMRKDKKNVSDKFGVILSKGLGKKYIVQITEKELNNSFNKYKSYYEKSCSINTSNDGQ